MGSLPDVRSSVNSPLSLASTAGGEAANEYCGALPAWNRPMRTPVWKATAGFTPCDW